MTEDSLYFTSERVVVARRSKHSGYGSIGGIIGGVTGATVGVTVDVLARAEA